MTASPDGKLKTPVTIKFTVLNNETSYAEITASIPDYSGYTKAG